MTKRRTFTAEFKAKAVLSVLIGEKTASQLCREYGLKETVFSRWKQQFLERAPQVFVREQPDNLAETRIAELEGVIGRLTVELEIAKKASLYLGQPERRNAR
jgi:transposase